MIRIPRTALLAAALGLTLSACSMPTRLEPLKDASVLKPDEVLLVGRVELLPALGAKEQDLDFPALTPEITRSAHDHNTFMAFLGDKFEDQSDQRFPGTGYWFHNEFGKPFYITHPVHETHLNMLEYTRTYNSRQIFYIRLPVGFKIPVDAKDRAVYVGTIRYERTDFGDITGVTVLDQMDRERPAFEKKFGKGLRLIRRLAVPEGKITEPPKRTAGPDTSNQTFAPLEDAPAAKPKGK